MSEAMLDEKVLCSAIEQNELQVKMAHFPSLPRETKTDEHLTHVPFNSDPSLSDFLTSDACDDGQTLLELAAIAKRSSLLEVSLYVAQKVYSNAGKILFDSTTNEGECPELPNSNRKSKERRRSKNHRSRRGCWTCRLRHKACPEDGNPCGACSRLNLQCDTAICRPKYMQDTSLAAERLREIRLITDKVRGRYERTPTKRKSQGWGKHSYSTSTRRIK